MTSSRNSAAGGASPSGTTRRAPGLRGVVGASFAPILRYLPRGGTLPPAIWKQRHRALVALLWLHALALPLIGVINGNGALHSVLEGGIVTLAALVATSRSFDQSVRMAAATFGLMSSSALLVHFSHGLIEMHFHFFVMVALITLYQSWMPFLLALGYVVLHHGTMGALDAVSVYNHAAAIASPWKWALVHGFFIMGESIALLIGWRMNEDARAAAEVSYQQQLREEHSRREAQDKYKQIFENAVEGIYECSIEGKWYTINPAIPRMLGYSSVEDLLQHAPYTRDLWVLPEEREKFLALLHETGEIHGFEYQARRKDGTIVWISNHARLVRNAGGNPVGILGMVEDITERIRAEADRSRLEGQLRQFQKMEAVGQLAGGVAHDFNNLLAVIQNYAAFVAEDIAETDPRREDVAEIQRASERAAALTRQLLAFSRREDIEPEVVNLNDVVSGLEKMLTRTIREDIELKVDLASELWRTKIDRGQLEQIILNIVVNARDAMPDGGILTIGTANASVDESLARELPGLYPGEYACLSFCDEGYGMTEDVRSRVFEPFFTTKPRGSGTGLGLATTYGIVKQAEGYVSVASEPGVGTTFTVYLPATTETAAESSSPADRTPDSDGGKTILVAEDEEGVRKLIDRILSRHGHRVLTAATGEEALELSKRNGPIDLLLTDVIMPKMSGKDLAARIEALYPGIEIIYMSGYTDRIVTHHGVREDGKSFLSKPFAAHELLRLVGEQKPEPEAGADYLAV